MSWIAGVVFFRQTNLRLDYETGSAHGKLIKVKLSWVASLAASQMTLAQSKTFWPKSSLSQSARDIIILARYHYPIPDPKL